MIEHIDIKNFKSLRDISLDLNPFSVFVGANAVGKTNFISAFSLLRESLGIGGVNKPIHTWNDFLTIGLDKNELMKFKFDFVFDGLTLGRKVEDDKRLEYLPSLHEYELEIRSDEGKVVVSREELEGELRCEEDRDMNIDLSFIKTYDIVKKEHKLKTSDEDEIELIDFDVDELFISSPFIRLGKDKVVPNIVRDAIQDIDFYNFSPDSARRVDGNNDDAILLDESGSNLVNVLEELNDRKNKKIRDRITKLMSLLVPGFVDWKIEEYFRGSIIFKILEEDKERGLYPYMVSDGTIRLLQLLTAILFRPKTPFNFICIEEPERNLHPQVLETLVEFMRNVCEESNIQIIITTHSPEFVKYLKPEELYLMDKIDGDTQIIPAKDIEMIDEFLKEFTLDEAWLYGYLDRE